MKKQRKIPFIAFLLIVNLFWGLVSSSQERYALVIGNAGYDQSPLSNPVNDANAVSQALTEVGFDVTLKTDVNRQDMENAVRSFSAKIGHGDIAIFCYFGHGMQVNNINYLIPVGESIYSETEVPYKSVEIQYVIDQLQTRKPRVNILVLDACRDNPFRSFRTLSRGFVAVTAPADTYIAFSTLPGNVAADGAGRNSPFTKSFVACVKIPDLTIENMFKEVRRRVLQETGGKQRPCEYTSLESDFYFNGSGSQGIEDENAERIRVAVSDYNNAFSQNSCGSILVKNCLNVIRQLAPGRVTTCETCNGSGNNDQTSECARCNGSGRTPCSYCLVSPRGNRYPGLMKCPLCKGEGGKWVTRYSEVRGTDVKTCIEECKPCNGRGVVTCTGCNGTGFITCNSCDGGIIHTSRCCSDCKGAGRVVN